MLMSMCEWRGPNKERNLPGHLWWCYPRSTVYLAVTIFLVLFSYVIFDLLGGGRA